MSKHPAAKWNPADFRLHPGLAPPAPHWLLDQLYGRMLLASELRRVRQDLVCSRYDPDPELIPELDRMIERLGLRKWPRPLGVGEHVRAVMLLVHMTCAVDAGNALPSWTDRLSRKGRSAGIPGS